MRFSLLILKFFVDEGAKMDT